MPSGCTGGFTIGLLPPSQHPLPGISASPPAFARQNRSADWAFGSSFGTCLA